MSPQEKKRLAESVRRACLKAASEAFEEAAMQGLCMEGAVEAAQGAIGSLDLKNLIEQSACDRKSDSPR